MIQCQNCINWVDESLVQIENDARGSHVFMGCRIYGFQENTVRESCTNYVESENLFTLCGSCRVPVPKVCVSLGECVNCTNTDLFCVEQCIGGEQRKYCTHFARLYSEGAHLIHDGQAYELFPAIGMPDSIKSPKK